MLKKWFKPNKPEEAEEWIGREGVVTRTILPKYNKGRVNIDGREYEARIYQRSAIIEGYKVIVEKKEGNVVYVKEKEFILS